MSRDKNDNSHPVNMKRVKSFLTEAPRSEFSFGKNGNETPFVDLNTINRHRAATCNNLLTSVKSKGCLPPGRVLSLLSFAKTDPRVVGMHLVLHLKCMRGSRVDLCRILFGVMVEIASDGFGKSFAYETMLVTSFMEILFMIRRK